MSPAADKGAIAFAEKLLSLLDAGSFVSTYKYAVLLSLIDLCLEESTRSGSAPTAVTTGQLARKIIESFWSHTLPYANDRVLRQNSGGQAEILTLIARFKSEIPGGDRLTPGQASRLAAAEYQKLNRDVEWVLVEMPLPKLQRFGHQDDAFIYRIGWDDGVRRGFFNSDGFDNRILFVGAAGDHLVRLAGIIRPIVQREWASRVAKYNKQIVEESKLESFLFGPSRIPLAAVRTDLAKLQNGRCFYCHDAFSGTPEVDHFVPWARYPNNGIGNLVLSHRRCNGAKRDHLADTSHVERWLARFDAHADDLTQIAEDRRWEHHTGRSISVARSIYLRLPDDAQLWQRVLGRTSEFAVIDRPRLVDAFSEIAA